MKSRPESTRMMAASLAICGAIIVVSVKPTKAVAQECKFATGETVHAVAARDGRTLLLDDGRELRLAGIDVREHGQAALQILAAGKNLQVRHAEAKFDRYGRLYGFAFPEGARQSLQSMLLERGSARVSPRVGDKQCTAALLRVEQTARSDRRGLWADPNFAPLRADNVAQIKTKQGRFALIEGKVLSVRESGATIYLNFGRHWAYDFSVIIPRRLERLFAGNGISPKQLEGKHIRVRGWVEKRRGPVIVADSPEQIERVN
jgi:endonuclease YncB( thermonuclease family)